MEWQAIVLVMQILMLAVGWFLFQQARGELSARAAETPILGEVKALQRSIKQLLSDLEITSDHSSLQLEAKCEEAKQLLYSLTSIIEEIDVRKIDIAEINANQDRVLLAKAAQNAPTDNLLASMNHSEAHPVSATMESIVIKPQALVVTQSARELRREKIFALADSGHAAAAIARETGISEGEIELLLGLRLQRA